MPKLSNDAPATVGMIRRIRREMDELRTELFAEIHDVDEKQSTITDELTEKFERNRRAIARVKNSLEEGEVS